ncbi:restriction endonuclease subunit S [Anabaena sp. FACHB-709]|uniref:Type I restriction modification DNA specificity domain-containing protein n=1 Tax=Trichormus variabilis NIES-23 TaxID=1973479 RepID=A0A1Z4KJU9_ANAVA|nr:restriction endonuclease subunit S [Nostoc sp. PCC 7120 = FACHB-418]RUR71984.1 hypothetical protein DSM107007_58890 [Nostoc sp. PCC 7120 = FACHB-418]BAB75322.1 alr3623 [Nostoc sp. PCC 7120 = FACHB-418]BAY69250.1 hypothetical protein NIES23_20440 [Trichormus variabilis NIES-23]
MKVDTFFQNFELLTDAPNAVVKLRDLILQLAVRGKLVFQNNNDEPAKILLNRIKAEKQETYSQKRVKTIKSLPPICEHETHFKKPQNWEWCRLGDIIHISSGNYLPSHKMADDGQIPVYGGNGITGYHDQNNINKPTLRHVRLNIL